MYYIESIGKLMFNLDCKYKLSYIYFIDFPMHLIQFGDACYCL